MERWKQQETSGLSRLLSHLQLRSDVSQPRFQLGHAASRPRIVGPEQIGKARLLTDVAVRIAIS